MSTQTFRQRKGIAAYKSVQRMAPQIVERRRNPEPDWFAFTRRGESRVLTLMCVACAAVWAMHIAGWLV